MTVTLIESRTDGVKARVRLISSGLGSSGYYPAAVLERDGAAAFPAGSFIYYNHRTESEEYERNGSRDVRDIVGKLLTDAEYVAEEEALYADALFYGSDADRVKAIAEDVELSIEASGKRNEETGEITELIPHPHNAVTIVPRGGRDGKITEFLESLKPPETLIKESGTINSNENPPEKEPFSMTPEEIQTLAGAIAAALKPSLDAIQESVTPAVPDSDEETNIADVVEALIDADIPKDLRARIYESSDPLTLIADFKSIRESLAGATPPANEAPVGRVQESGKATTSFITTAWGNK